ncbi:hypothetical protein M1523_01000 [Patescibacteria group bacterium]|nr:hypothetical protein [Patescibacteria group bacterium]MCL5091735.1 hypothetical protein [Patescibacteria group bacterium]
MEQLRPNPAQVYHQPGRPVELVTNGAMKRAAAAGEGILVSDNQTMLRRIAGAEGVNHVITASRDANGLPFVVNTAMRKGASLVDYLADAEQEDDASPIKVKVVTDTGWEVNGLTLNKHAGEQDNLNKLKETLANLRNETIASTAGIVVVDQNGIESVYYSRLIVGKLINPQLLSEMIDGNPQHAGGLTTLELLRSNAIINGGLVDFSLHQVDPTSHEMVPVFASEIKVDLKDEGCIKLINGLAQGIIPDGLVSTTAVN